MDSLKGHTQVSVLLKITLHISNSFRKLRGIQMYVLHQGSV